MDTGTLVAVVLLHRKLPMDVFPGGEALERGPQLHNLVPKVIETAISVRNFVLLGNPAVY